MEFARRERQHDAVIAILVWNYWRGGMIRVAFSLARLLAGRPWDSIGRVRVVIGIRSDGPYDFDEMRREIADVAPAVTIRRLDVASIARTTASNMFPGVPVPPVEEVLLPRDGAHDFLDCDAWIGFSSSMEGCVLAARPYAVFCADQIQRYVPTLYGNGDGHPAPMSPVFVRSLKETYLGWRSARCVFATTPQTLNDVIGYAGVRKANALLAPTLIDPVVLPAEVAAPPGEPGIVWVTNGSVHKNHPVAVEALRIYYDELGGTLPLTVMGDLSELLEPSSKSDIAAVRAFRDNPSVMRRTRTLGRIGNALFDAVIRSCAVVWHNVIIDNGTLVAFDAVRADKLLVSSDYPQMRYLCDRYGVSALWFPAHDARAAAHALLEGERLYRAGASPGHAPREDTDDERIAAYGTIVRQLLGENA
jgi:hypothetical protein